MNDWSSALGHSLSLTAIVGSILGIFTPIAAFAAVLFYVIQIYESKTVQTYIRHRRQQKLEKARARLRDLERRLKED